MAQEVEFKQGMNRRVLALQDYAAVGDGRSVAIIGRDGAVAFWCVPNLDSHPLFDSLIDPAEGGSFTVEPTEDYTAVHAYRKDSNVLETTLATASGVIKITDSMNSNLAGRLPWCELARRVEVISGTVSIRLSLVCGTRSGTVSPWLESNTNRAIFHVGKVLGVLRASPNLKITEERDDRIAGEATLQKGDRAIIAIIAGEDQPLGVPQLEDIDSRIELSHEAWHTWATNIKYDGPHVELVRRSALILKLLLFPPSGAIAAAATTSLPERIGGKKNYDYRYAWVRDASYTIHAFLWLGQIAESQAAIEWLLKKLGKSGTKVCFRLDGSPVPEVQNVDLAGYRDSRPVVLGNVAGTQHQHGVYGDIFEAVSQFIESGNILDRRSATTLAELADECSDKWHEKDSGIWELEEKQHYTMSKISAWQALNRAVELSDGGHLPSGSIPRWSRERDRIAGWIDAQCWSEKQKAYTFYPGTDRLDASLVLAVRFGFPNVERLSSTLDVINKKLRNGPWIYRFSGAEAGEGAFIACSFWLVEAYATLDKKREAAQLLDEILKHVGSPCGIMSEMIDPKSGDSLGNLPQGLSHLALIHAVLSIYGKPRV